MNIAFGILIFLSSTALISADIDDEEVESGYRPVVISNGYDPKQPPALPVEIKVTMHILDIISVDDFNQEFTMQFYFRQRWNDPRLNYADFGFEESEFAIVPDFQAVWTPDSFFAEERVGKLHTIMLPNAFMRVYPLNDVFYSTKLSMTFHCSMDLRYFPFDYQKCKFSIESYGLSSNSIKYSWAENGRGSVSISEYINMPDFQFVNLEYGSEIIEMSTGNYSNLNLELTFRRKVGFFMSKIFVPFIILVLVSWLSFWIKPKLAFLRLTVVLTTLFIMLMLASDIKDSVPPVSYIKAIDVWIGVCLSFAFGTLLQSVFVSQWAKREKRKEKAANDPKLLSVEYERLKTDLKDDSLDSERAIAASQMVANSLNRDRRRSERIDIVSRISFPALFGLFNLIYWLVYTSDI